MEELRQARIRALADRAEPLKERERLMFIRGIGERTIELLSQAGYRTVDDLAAEDDLDRLALSTGLGLRKARVIFDGIKQYLESEMQVLANLQEQAREKAKEKAESEAAEATEAAEAAEAAQEEAADDSKPVESDEPETDGETKKPEEEKEEESVDMDAVDEDW